jgi:hypothetical protein
MFHTPPNRMLTRRQALRTMGCGFGYLSLASLVGESLARAESSSDRASWMITDKPRAKHVIFLFMNGGLSQIDSFDYKPALEKYHGQPMPGGALAHERKTGNLMKSPFTFKKYGKSGIEVSEIFPNLGECVDDMCFVRSVYTEIPNHEPALEMMNTGANFSGRPSMGSWLTYGLGSMNKNLPGFVVLCPEVPTTVGPPLWSSAFLSPMHQGTYVSDAVSKSEFDPQKLIANIHNDQFDLDPAAQGTRPSQTVGSVEHEVGGRRQPRPATRRHYRRHGNRIPHADRGSRCVRRAQGIPRSIEDVR